MSELPIVVTPNFQRTPVEGAPVAVPEEEIVGRNINIPGDNPPPNSSAIQRGQFPQPGAPPPPPPSAGVPPTGSTQGQPPVVGQGVSQFPPSPGVPQGNGFHVLQQRFPGFDQAAFMQAVQAGDVDALLQMFGPPQVDPSIGPLFNAARGFAQQFPNLRFQQGTQAPRAQPGVGQRRDARRQRRVARRRALAGNSGAGGVGSVGGVGGVSSAGGGFAGGGGFGGGGGFNIGALLARLLG